MKVDISHEIYKCVLGKRIKINKKIKTNIFKSQNLFFNKLRMKIEKGVDNPKNFSNIGLSPIVNTKTQDGILDMSEFRTIFMETCDTRNFIKSQIFSSKNTERNQDRKSNFSQNYNDSYSFKKHQRNEKNQTNEPKCIDHLNKVAPVPVNINNYLKDDPENNKKISNILKSFHQADINKIESNNNMIYKKDMNKDKANVSKGDITNSNSSNNHNNNKKDDKNQKILKENCVSSQSSKLKQCGNLNTDKNRAIDIENSVKLKKIKKKKRNFFCSCFF